jgi:hypothetical protein
VRPKVGVRPSARPVSRSGGSNKNQTDRLTLEQKKNYVLPLFREDIMFRAVVEEAAALASISLFIGMIAIWAQVLGTL